MSQWDALFQSAGQKYNVDPKLIAALVQTESSGNPNAYNAEYGATGLGQQIPATAKALGIDPKDPAQSIEGVAKLLNENLARYGSPEQAVLAYHGGTDQANWGPKTHDYLRKVSANYGAPPVARASAIPDDEFEAAFGARPTAQVAAAPMAVDEFEAAFGPRPTAPATQAAPAVVATQAPPTAAQPAPDAPTGVLGTAADLIDRFGAQGLRNANAVGRGISDVFDAPSEWLAAGAEKSGLTGLLGQAGINMPTAAQQIELNKQSRADYDARNQEGGFQEGASRIGGNIIGTAGPIAKGGQALVQGGNALINAMRATPVVEKAIPAAQAAGKFVSGSGGLLSRMTNSGIQGGVAGGLMSGGQPGQSLGEAMGIGTVLGAASSPIISGLVKGGSAIAGAPIFNPVKRAITPAASVAPEADRIVADFVDKTIKEGGSAQQYTPTMLASIRKQVIEALRVGKELDPAALARKLEFESVGVTPTLGQVTRDPGQFTQERNMRGIVGAGESLTNRFSKQNDQMIELINKMGARHANEPDVAGSALISRLQALDKPKATAVSQAYSSARDTSGRYAELDVPTFSNTANGALDEQMLGHFLPGEVRGLLNDISAGKIPLNVNTAVQADSVMSAAQRGASARGDKAAAKAIGVVRDSLNDAPITSDAGAAAKQQFDTARELARKRFAEIEGAPALKAALDNESPDRFVQKYLIAGDTPGVNALSKYLQGDPESLVIARQQIAGYLQNKGFGTNAAGDNQFAQASYNKALASIGTNKLNAFFSPEEVQHLKTIGKVGAYINAHPSGAAVNTSNSGSAVANLLGDTLGGLGKLPGINIARDTFRTYAKEKAATVALDANIKPTRITPKDHNSLLNLLAPVSASGADKNK